MSKVLIVYYSRKGENYWNGSIHNLKKGNTEIAAEYIQNAVGGDLFEIDTVKTYSTDYTKCTEEAMAEKKATARPELKEIPKSIDEYDTIFIGFPSWWGTMPMAMFTFLENFDFSGKTLIPFCSNEGSGLGSSVNDLKNACKTANVKAGLSIHGSETENLESTIANWAKNSI